MLEHAPESEPAF